MNKTIKRILLGTILVAVAGIINCGGHGHHDHYYHGWYDVYGDHCGSLGPGCNYYSNGLKIIDVEDPYFYGDYYLEYGTWFYYDSYGHFDVYVGWAWESPTGIIYDDWGNALNEEQNSGKDIVGDVAVIEKSVIKSAGQSFAARYQLNEEVGIQVARVLNDWATLGKTRARTAADTADFAQRLYGIEVNEIKVALEEAKAGNLSPMEATVEKAAKNWNTTPETFKEIQKSWFGNQLKGFGL